MKTIKGFFVLTQNFFVGYFSCIKFIFTKESVFWSINETFFYGKKAKAKRDMFQKDYKELVKKYRALINK